MLKSKNDKTAKNKPKEKGFNFIQKGSGLDDMLKLGKKVYNNTFGEYGRKKSAHNSVMGSDFLSNRGWDYKEGVEKAQSGGAKLFSTTRDDSLKKEMNNAIRGTMFMETDSKRGTSKVVFPQPEEHRNDAKTIRKKYENKRKG